MSDMETREWLAHAALRATLDFMDDRSNPVKRGRFGDAVDRLCPECEHSIMYCRCFEQAAHPDRNRRRAEVR